MNPPNGLWCFLYADATVILVDVVVGADAVRAVDFCDAAYCIVLVKHGCAVQVGDGDPNTIYLIDKIYNSIFLYLNVA